MYGKAQTPVAQHDNQPTPWCDNELGVGTEATRVQAAANDATCVPPKLREDRCGKLTQPRERTPLRKLLPSHERGANSQVAYNK